jgi:hypothetical protein
MLTVINSALLLFLVSPAASVVPDEPEPAVSVRLVRAAQDLLHRPRSVPKEVTTKCTSFVQWVYAQEGLLLTPEGGNVEFMYGAARRLKAVRRRAAEPGDLVFFRNTYDRDGNGVLDDGLTHVGIVEAVDDDGVISFIHAIHGGVTRSRLDFRHPRTHRRKGEVRNDYLRTATDTWPAALAGQLLAGFASASRLAEVLVTDETGG